MGCGRARWTRQRYHDHRRLACTLVNLRYPHVRRRILGKKNRNRAGGLIGFYKVKSKPFERSAQTVLHNLTVTLAEGRTVLDAKGDRAGPGHRNNLARELLLRPAPIR